MNNKVNYTVVGLLVLFGFMLMAGFSYWLLKPTQEDETTKYYIYFDESVLGLNLDAPVKYRGISVGKVTRLRINPKNSEQVEVLITVLKTTPIKETTVAKLTSQGITGLSYINLSLGDNNAPLLKAKEGERYPVIKTVPSFFERFEKSLGTVSTRVSKTLSKAEELLNDDNQEQISLLLKRSAGVMDRLEKLLDEKSIDHVHNTLANLDDLSEKVDLMMPKVSGLVDNSVRWENNISNSLNSIMKSYLVVRGTMGEVKEALASGQFNLKEITKDVLPTIDSTMLELQQLMVRMEEALNKYERSPSDIIFTKEQIKKGPGE